MKKKNLIIVAIAILILIVGGYFLFAKKQEGKQLTKNQSKTQQEENKEEVKKDTKIDTSNWKTYRSEEYGLEIRYPLNWNLINLSNDNAITIGEKTKKKGSYISIHFKDWFDITKNYFVKNSPKTIETKSITIGGKGAIITNDKIETVTTDYESFLKGCGKFAITVKPTPRNWGNLNVIEAYSPCEKKSSLILKKVLDSIIIVE